jgi:metal-dependent amidase/aminoacylase/carboxypeptidase family protein
MEGTLRTNHPESRTHMLKRIQEVIHQTAELYGGTAEIRFFSNNPPLICNPELTNEVVEYLQELEIPGFATIPGITASASEDFAAVAEQVPGSFLYLSAGFPDHRGDAPAHNSKVRFNEDVLPIGAGGLAHCALRWLAEHK